MKYTGEKFSLYCGCKREETSDEIVTEYDKNLACKNAFGCKIRPVKPSISHFKI